MSKVTEIKKCISNFLNTKGYKTIVAPTNNAAPKGKYFSVSNSIVSDYGSKMFNREVADGKDTIYESIHQNIMGIVIHEIDGDGEDLRQIKHLLQTNEFNDHVKNWFSDEEEPHKNNAFTILDFQSISDLTTLDGDFFVQQYVFEFNIIFNDYVAQEVNGITEGIELDLNDESLIINK